MTKKHTRIIAAAGVILMLNLASCGGKNAYGEYNEAYKKTASVGSLNVEFDLSVDKGDETVESEGNMKMNNAGDVYYEMKINGKDILQYVQNGEVHTFVDGEEQVTSTEDKNNGTQKADPNGGEGQPNAKEDGTAFESEKFLEEFSGMLEAGKIKEMGILDPIPSKYIRSIEKTVDGSDTVYTMTFPDEFLQRLLDAMIDEQVSSDGGLTFSNLKDFTCITKANSDGFMNYIEYKGYTTVTVPAKYMTSGEDEVFDLHIELSVNIINPGVAAEVVIPE